MSNAKLTITIKFRKIILLSLLFLGLFGNLLIAQCPTFPTTCAGDFQTIIDLSNTDPLNGVVVPECGIAFVSLFAEVDNIPDYSLADNLDGVFVNPFSNHEYIINLQVLVTQYISLDVDMEQNIKQKFYSLYHISYT